MADGTWMVSNSSGGDRKRKEKKKSTNIYLKRSASTDGAETVQNPNGRSKGVCKIFED